MKTVPLLASAATLLALAFPLQAQQTVPNRDGAAPSESTVVLSPFLVETNQDHGYTATNTASGGRLSTNLLKTPADITVQTREFLDDLNAFSLADAYVWLPGAEFDDSGTAADFGSNVTFNGMGKGGTNTRNNVRFDTTAEEFNTERVENSRGPNSILYGDSNVSGTINVTSKQAKFRNFTTTRFIVDSEASRRGNLDFNRKLHEKLAVRFNGLLQERRGWLDGYYDDKAAGGLAVTFRPWKRTEIRFDGELTYGNKSRSSTWGQRYTDQNSLWDRTTVIDAPLAATFASGNTGVTRLAAANIDRLTLSAGWDGFLNLRNYGRTQGTTLPIVDEQRPFANFPVLPRRSFQIAPPESRHTLHSYVSSVTVEHTFESRLTLELMALTAAVRRDVFAAGYGNNAFIDVIRTLPDGRRNPNLGKLYSEGNYSENHIDQYIDDYRVSAAYPLPLQRFKQTFAASAERREKLFDVTNYNWVRTNGAVANVRANDNQIFTWRYWDDAGRGFYVPRNENGVTVGRASSRDTRNPDTLESVQVNTVGQYFNDRLTVIAGVRWDGYVANTREATGWDLQGVPNLYQRTNNEVSNTTRSYGATYFPVNYAGVYANYSEGFLPSFTQNPFIGSRGVVYVKTQDSKTAGLRFNLLSGKVVGSVGYYQQVEHGRLVSFSTARINEIWADLGKPQSQITSINGSFADTTDLAGRGYTFELTANPTREVRMIFNLSIPRSAVQSATNPDTREYFAANIAEWRAGATNPANPNRTRIATNITSIESSISNLTDGRFNNGFSKFRLNAFGNYRFAAGALKGLTIGGGTNVFGRKIIGNQPNQPYNYIYAKEYFLVTGTVGYDFKWRNTPVNVNLAVTNLLDYEDPIFTSAVTYQGVAYREDYHYEDPRKATLSATFRF